MTTGLRKKIGVLAIQGAFSEHVEILDNLISKHDYALDVQEIRTEQDFNKGLQGLIIPGGETTTLDKFFTFHPTLFEHIKSWLALGDRVVWGTCAGLIFLASKLEGEKQGGQLRLGVLNITARRNHFGRQRQSFNQDIILSPDFAQDLYTNESCKFPGIFIRAPGIGQVNEGVRILATLPPNDEPVAVEEGSIMATSFHPELTGHFHHPEGVKTGRPEWHEYFIKKVLRAAK